jgi:hypothetical protein
MDNSTKYKMITHYVNNDEFASVLLPFQNHHLFSYNGSPICSNAYLRYTKTNQNRLCGADFIFNQKVVLKLISKCSVNRKNSNNLDLPMGEVGEPSGMHLESPGVYGCTSNQITKACCHRFQRIRN